MRKRRFVVIIAIVFIFLFSGSIIAQRVYDKDTQDIIDSAEKSGVDKDKILQEEIRKIVVLAEAEKQGLAVSYEEAEEYTMANYNAAKEENGQTYKILLDYMEAMKLTEKQYLELCISSDQKKLTRAKLYEKFAEDKEGTYEEKVAEYKKYVDSLVKKAKIEYK